MTKDHKSKRAVLVSLEKDDSGIRIRLDDIESDSAVGTWLQSEHFTNKAGTG
jgi:hypothetical protein